MSRLLDVQVRNFRCFKELGVGKLTRVNLIVGANNAGKTALLEAIEIFASRGNPARLWVGLERRGEFVRDQGGTALGPVQYDLRQLVAGRPEGLNEGLLFSVSATVADNEPQPDQVTLSAIVDRRFDARGTVVRFQRKSNRYGDGHGASLRLSSRLGFGDEAVAELGDVASTEETPTLFVPGGEVSPASLRRLWGEVVGNPDEHYVRTLAAMVDKRITGFVVAPINEPRGWEGVFLKLEGQKSRVPIGGFGDGLRRALLFAVALARCRGGTLLIDELDDGLHYTLLPQLWRFLVDGARAMDVQIFVTSHSKDCLEAIGLLHSERPDFARDISIHRLETGCTESIDLAASDVATALASDQEVR